MQCSMEVVLCLDNNELLFGLKTDIIKLIEQVLVHWQI